MVWECVDEDAGVGRRARAEVTGDGKNIGVSLALGVRKVAPVNGLLYAPLIRSWRTRFVRLPSES